MDKSKTPEQGNIKKITGKIVKLTGKAALASGLIVLSHGAVAGAAEPAKPAPTEYDGNAGGLGTYVDSGNSPSTTTTTSPETDVPVSIPPVEKVEQLDPTPTTIVIEDPRPSDTTTTKPYDSKDGLPTYVDDGKNGTTSTTTEPASTTTEAPTSTVYIDSAIHTPGQLALTGEHQNAPATGEAAIIGTGVGIAALGLANARKNAQQNHLAPSRDIPSA